MERQEGVSADPFQLDVAPYRYCFACKTSSAARPSLETTLTPLQITNLAAVQTEDVRNPFLDLNSQEKQRVFLCSDCRHKNRGLLKIIDIRRYGDKVSSRALTAWMSRCRAAGLSRSDSRRLDLPNSSVGITSSSDVVTTNQAEVPRDLNIRRRARNSCCLCDSGTEGFMDNTSSSAPASGNLEERAPVRDLALFNISCNRQEVKTTFVSELCKMSSCSAEVVQYILEDPSKVVFCPRHLSHVRYAHLSAQLTEITHEDNELLCVFFERGCSGKVGNSGRLWKLPVIDTRNLANLEKFSDMDEMVFHHSNGALHAVDVMGSRCCRSCLYLVTEGKMGKNPSVSDVSMSSVVDKWLLRCVEYALEDSTAISDVFLDEAAPIPLSAVADRLRDDCICSMTEGSKIRMVPFQSVCRARQSLVDIDLSGLGSSRNVDDRTVENRLRLVLSSNGIVLKKFSSRLRCYVRVSSVDMLLTSIARDRNAHLPSLKRPTILEMREFLSKVEDGFMERKGSYWEGNWSLTTEISKIPKALWLDVIMLMVSDRRLNMCIEDALNYKGSPYPRADLLICVRVFRAVELMVMSRSNGTPGPLTISTSVSGICEVSPSFVSVLHAMGLFVSYSVTERYRQQLIARRESEGPWNVKHMDPVAIPILQFDNWDIKPLHAVKVDGKPMPKVNGSLLQGHTRKRRLEGRDQVEVETKRQRCAGWKPVSQLGDRESFCTTFNTDSNGKILTEFNNIVFGLGCLYRGNLLGGKDGEDSEYNVGTLPSLMYCVDDMAVNFRTLLLSSFKPHGGRPSIDEHLLDQHIVYIDISRESAADILTVRRYLRLIEEHIQPGKKGCPRYVVLGGDQPSYKMFVELWLKSWRASKRSNSRTMGAPRPDDMDTEGERKLDLHEWMIPFPGFFHAEKQAMYSLCKEMLDGLGLSELASCAGLSKSQVANIISHSHARNNRAVLFNLACAMLIHLIDMSAMEDESIAESIRKLYAEATAKIVSIDTAAVKETSSSDIGNFSIGDEVPKPAGELYSQTTDLVTSGVIDVGSALVEYVKKRFTSGPNGMHFIGTVLFSCLLPTIGFHVLSRTGHTDFMDAFWFKHNAILHSSTHLKYQELSMFYAFFRAIIPDVVAEELFRRKPGRSVLKLLSFTGRGKGAMDRRGWTYVHCDEALEMLNVRHLKALSVNFLGHLENSAAWLMEVSMFRSLIRYVTGASRSYGRKREIEEGGEALGPLSEYDATACQWRTVARMLDVMRQKGFLSVSHRGSEWLLNVFANPPTRMNIEKDQQLILDVSKRGELTSTLHASVLFPDVFGPLTDQDRKEHFDGKQFKKWTKSRAIPRPAQSMAKANGAATQAQNDGSEAVQEVVFDATQNVKRSVGKEAFLKVLSESRRKLSKAKDAFYMEERKALRLGDSTYLREVQRRWDEVLTARHRISPFADGFLSQNGNLNHGAKSRFLKYSRRNNRDLIYNLNKLPAPDVNAAQPSRLIFDSVLPMYYSVQIDVMNALHYRGDADGAGTTVENVVRAKMLNVLRPWTQGQRARELRQLHLHIDDPGLVITQKCMEQSRRDNTRQRSGAGEDNEDLKCNLLLPDFQDELTVSWNMLISDRVYKDELASLHLFCAAVAAFEILSSSGRDCQVFLHGGNFAVESDFSHSLPSHFKAWRYKDDMPEIFRGSVILRTEGSQSQDLALIPRSRCLIFDTAGRATVGEHSLEHGEAETRFVAAFRCYIQEPFDEAKQERMKSFSLRERDAFLLSGSLIISKDTDVFMILLANPALRGQGVMHILNDSVHFLDDTFERLNTCRFSALTLSIVYALAGCDFTPSLHGFGHEVYLQTLLDFEQFCGCFEDDTSPEYSMFETFICLLYLHKHGKRTLRTRKEYMVQLNELTSTNSGPADASNKIAAVQKSTYVSDDTVGSTAWKEGVRNFIADKAASANELMPPFRHYVLQVRRAQFVVMKYWGRSMEARLSAEVVGGCDSDYGYFPDGEVLLQRAEDVALLQKEIRSLVMFCACNGDCSSRRCSCRKASMKCIGCTCNEVICKNRVRNELDSVPSASGMAHIPIESEHPVASGNQETLEEGGEGDKDDRSDSSSECNMVCDSNSLAETDDTDIDEMHEALQLQL